MFRSPLYSIIVFVLVTFATTVQSQELVPNSDVENGQGSNPDYYYREPSGSPYASWATDASHSPTRSLKISTSTTGEVKWFSQAWGVEAGHQYVFSARVKQSGINTDIGGGDDYRWAVIFRFGTGRDAQGRLTGIIGNDHYLWLDQSTPDRDWYLLTIPMTSPANAQYADFDLRKRVYATGTVWTDDISCQPVEASTIPGNLSQLHTETSISVTAPYTGDGDGDGWATMALRLSSVGDWGPDSLMLKGTSYYVQSRIGLIPDTLYDIRVTFLDPDSVLGENPLYHMGIRTSSQGTSVSLLSWNNSHFRIAMGPYTIHYDTALTDGYIFISSPSNSSFALATRGVHGSLFDLTLPEHLQSIEAAQDADEVTIVLSGELGWADYTLSLWVYKNQPGLIRWKGDLNVVTPQIIGDYPRDLIFYDRANNQPVNGTVMGFTEQAPFAAGVCYLYESALISSQVFYFENFSSLNDYFSLMQQGPQCVVSWSDDAVGYQRPVNATIPLPAETSVTMGDSYLYLSPGAPPSEADMAKWFLQCLAAVYYKIYKPNFVDTDWHQVAVQELVDLLDPRCWATVNGHPLLRAYVNDPRLDSAELITQLDVLLAIEKFEGVYGGVTTIDDTLSSHLNLFYNSSHQTIVNDYPNEGISRGDSWYTMQLAIGLSRLAGMGNSQAYTLLINSTETIMDFAHNVDYEFPVFFEYGTNNPLSGSEPDVAGGYAYLMLNCYQLFGDETYLEEALASIDHIQGKGFELAYELHMTAASAAACARLYQLTGDPLYLEMSYLPLANIFRDCWLWECDYGYGEDYVTFFGLSPMTAAGVITMKEHYETWEYLKEYYDLVSGEIPGYVQDLIQGFLNYTFTNLRYSLPPYLPQGAVAAGPNGQNVPDMFIPLEDLREGWQQSGQIGQQIYGAGGPITLAARWATFVPPQDRNNLIPEKLFLMQNLPNPFNLATTIQYQIPTPQWVTLKVYNVLGQEVKTLVNKKQKAGGYAVRWNGKDFEGRDLPSGICFYRLKAGRNSNTKKMILLKGEKR